MDPDGLALRYVMYVCDYGTEASRPQSYKTFEQIWLWFFSFT